VDLASAIGEGSGGVPEGALLARFAEAATRGSTELASLRRELREAVGGAAFVEAAATVGIFNGLVRTADATGIPLDESTLASSADFRQRLGLESFAGARSSALGPSPERVRRSEPLR